jgi:hypothetical protein
LTTSTAVQKGQYRFRVVGTPFYRDRLDRRLQRVEREAWFGADEWRAATEWKVRRVRKWGVTPEGRLEWAARLGCTRLVATLLRRYWHELSIKGRASAAVTKALRAAACANDIESVEVRVSCVVCRVSCVVCRVSCVVCRVPCAVLLTTYTDAHAERRTPE